MTTGIGGAGSKLAVKYDPEASIVNVSDTELSKIDTPNKLKAVVHSANGQFQGARKDPQLGREAFQSIRRELFSLIRGSFVFSSTGGGTGNGMSSALLEEITADEDVDPQDRTIFGFVLPSAQQEPQEYVVNTVDFLQQNLSPAIDSGNTGNIFLFSNEMKFENRLSEDEYNNALIGSLRAFTSIPEKGERLKLLESHIDYEDFYQYISKPFFNHFTYFSLDPDGDFEKQLYNNLNPYLLLPENPIEALFLIEVPEGASSTVFYKVLDYFLGIAVTPVYGVVENPEIDDISITVSLLYSRKPAELVEDFNKITQEHAQAKVRKSLEQHLTLPSLEVNLEDEAKRAAEETGNENSEEVLSVLRRLGKI